MQQELTRALMDSLKRRYPYTAKFNHSYVEQKVIGDKMAKMHFFLLLIMLLSIGGLTIGYAMLVHELYKHILPLLMADGNTLYLFSWPVFCFPGFILALGTYAFPFEFVQKLILEEKYERFNDYYHITKGYDGEKVKYALLRLFSVLFVLAAIPFFSSFISVGTKSITIKHFYQLLPHTYQLDEIKKITYDTSTVTEKKEVYSRPHYQIFLKDGIHMNTLHWAFDDEEIIVPLIAQMHSTGTPIDTEWVSIHEGKWFQDLQTDN